MDPSHGSSSPVMSLSIGINAEGVHHGGRPKATQSDIAHNTTGSKRKWGSSDAVPITELSSSACKNSAAAGLSLGLGSTVSYGFSDSGSTSGSRPSMVNIFMRNKTEEGPHSSGNGGCFTSLTGGEGSVLTSVNAGCHQLGEVNFKAGNISLGLGPSNVQYFDRNGKCVERRDLNAENKDIDIQSNVAMQLQLVLSGSPAIISTSDGVLCPLLGHGVNSVHHETVVDDEGSTSARSTKVGRYIPSLHMGCLHDMDSIVFLSTTMEQQQSEGQRSDAYCEELGLEYTNKERSLQGDEFTGGTISLSGLSVSADKAPKTCKFQGCGKGARGASGLCITHGGGRRCQRSGCNKGAEGRTVYCKLHGGGRRCQSLGCTKSAEGKTDYCIGHGGGRRCSHDRCTKAARGHSGLCIRHGGGKRCQKEGCTKSAEGYSGLCISHGGGRRCQFAGCGKGAQGSTMFCKAHGGGKRCMIQGCAKGAEGSTPLCKGHGGGKRCMFDGGGICSKSVHGGTLFCVAHGGGKRCAVQGCSKSARGRTAFCVRHGGGKRCKFENCTKSAQGSTDFCKAHGGGKRCSWGQEGSPYAKFVTDKMGDLLTGLCDRFARGKIGLCAAHSALVQDRRVHGAGTIGNVLPAGIGPGLFRGLVKGSTHKGTPSGSTPAMSNELSEVHEEYRSDCREADASRIVVESPQDGPSEQASMERHEQVPIGYKSDLTFAGNHIEGQFGNNVYGAATLSDNSLSNLWRGIPISGQSKAKCVLNLEAADPGALSSHGDATSSAQASPSLGMSLPFCHFLLPPQVLVPLSMKRGEFTTGKHTWTSDVDGAVAGIEERIHGGSVLSLLSGIASQDSS